MDLKLDIGNLVMYKKRIYQIKSLATLSTVLIENTKINQQRVAKISELSPVLGVDKNIYKNNKINKYPEISLISRKDWREAKRRQQVIHPLAEQSYCREY